MLGVYKRFTESGSERVAVTNPVPSTQLGPDDVLIVLVRSKDYMQVEESVDPPTDELVDDDQSGSGAQSRMSPVEEPLQGSLISSGPGTKRLSLSEQIISDNQLSDLLGKNKS